MTQAAADFAHGALFWVKGWSYILRHRVLLTVALMPLLIAFLAALSLGWILWANLPFAVHLVMEKLSIPLGAWLYYPFLATSALVVFVSSLYATYIFQALLALPFNSYLAERTLKQLGKKSHVRRFWARHFLKMLWVSILKSVLLLLVGLVLFVFSFLPPLNLLAIVGALMILALDCMDYTLEALGFGLRRRFDYLFRHWAQWLGMAAGLGLTLLVPGLTLLVIPGAVVGSAMIVKVTDVK